MCTSFETLCFAYYDYNDVDDDDSDVDDYDNNVDG